MKRILSKLLGITALFIYSSCGTGGGTPTVGVVATPATESQNVSVDQSAKPQLRVEIPALFSPNLDVANDSLPIRITVTHSAPIKDWRIEIVPNRRVYGQTAPSQGEQVWQTFYETAGEGTPPSQWLWNGRSGSGEMVESASDYIFNLSVNDVNGNNATYEGMINVDVIVRREGNGYHIVVSDILFPPNSSNFSLLSEENRRINTRVMLLIAQALNRFPEYRITVEGHANPTTPPNSAQRTAEESGTASVLGLRPLSEARARAVADYIVQNGNVSSSRLTVVGMGGTRNVAAYNNAEENWKNRRVEFWLQR